MPIDKFSKQEFEAALPCHKETDEPLWEAEGMVQGEEQYAIHFTRKDNEVIRLVIRSSIDGSGYAADAGEDSIRMWLEAGEAIPDVIENERSIVMNGRDADGNYIGRYQSLGKGSSLWVTRVANWQDRMQKRLRELWAFGLKVSRCPEHGVWKFVKAAGKETKNPGRMFESCYTCYEEGKQDTRFRWLE